MALAGSDKRVEWHPVRGYATEEEYEQLKSLPAGYELNELKRKLKDRAKRGGKL